MPAKMDPELKVMSRCWKLLEELKPMAKTRVADWLRARADEKLFDASLEAVPLQTDTTLPLKDDE